MFWKAVTVAVLLIFAASEAQARPDRDRIREQLEFDLEVGEQFEIDGRQFNLNRIGRGKLGSKVMAGDNSDNEFMILTEDDDGNFYGSVLMDGANYRVMPDGNLRKAGRVKGNDTVIRQVFPSDRPMAFDGGDNGIVDRWHNPLQTVIVWDCGTLQITIAVLPMWMFLFTGTKTLEAIPSHLLMLSLPKPTKSSSAVGFTSDSI
jgi:hypothetical protein